MVHSRTWLPSQVRTVPTGHGPARTVGPSSESRTSILRRAIVQGKPVVRRGRKARDLPVTEDRPATEESARPHRLEGVRREDEPGSLHLGADAACIDGPDHWRRNALALTDDPDPQGSGLPSRHGPLRACQLRSRHRGRSALEVIRSSGTWPRDGTAGQPAVSWCPDDSRRSAGRSCGLLRPPVVDRREGVHRNSGVRVVARSPSAS